VKKLLFLVLIVAITSLSFAQVHLSNQVFLKTGITINVGTKINRVGGFVKTHYLHEHFQVNAQWRLYYALNSWGPNVARFENQLGFGAVALSGNRKQDVFITHSLIHHQSTKSYGLGYSLIHYFDDIGTTQLSGQMALHIKQFSVLFENDILGFTASDKYRTGALGLLFQNNNYTLGIKAIAWTGNAYDHPSYKVKDKNYPSRYGYFDMSKSRFAKFAQGVIVGEFAVKLGPNLYNFQLGTDSERGRHFIQNILSHDQILIPKSWSQENPHVPMIDKNGDIYLFKSDQQIEKAKFFGKVGLNDGLFY